MNKKLIRLTESDLHRIVKESVKKTLLQEKVWNQTNPYGLSNELMDVLLPLKEPLYRALRMASKEHIDGEKRQRLIDKLSDVYDTISSLCSARYTDSDTY